MAALLLDAAGLLGAGIDLLPRVHPLLEEAAVWAPALLVTQVLADRLPRARDHP